MDLKHHSEYWDDFIYHLNIFLYQAIRTFLDFWAWIFDFQRNVGLRENTDEAKDFLFRDILTRFTRELEFLYLPIWKSTARHINIEQATEHYVPNNGFEILFGMFPEVSPIQRVYFLDKYGGYFNFYVKDYLNAPMLPDWVSAFIQIRFHCDIDYSEASIVREAAFGVAWLFSELFNLRATMTLFIFINPYVFPWLIVGIFTDWLEEILSWVLPIVPFLDINYWGCRFLIGLSLDTLNNLILTFPFLPSEGSSEYIYDGSVDDTSAIVFRGIPVLWYRYGIPNELRQSWYYNAPDIFEYMKDITKDIDIQCLPDEVIEQINLQKAPISHLLDLDYFFENYHYLFNNNLQFNEFFKNIFNL